MANKAATILQIVPQLPGSYDGVGDYALTLAKSLATRYGQQTIFAVAQETSATAKEGFQVLSGLSSDLSREPLRFEHVVLHYANYGYQTRGVPFQLRDFARALRKNLPGRWITTFHELYASGPPWKSAFWVRPYQVKIARDMIDLSDHCVVSNYVIRDEIYRYDSTKQISVLPVMSNFGEPDNTDFSRRSPRRWAICGGTALLARSLHSFAAEMEKIPERYRPEQLEIVGGRSDSGIRSMLEMLKQKMPKLSRNYSPEVAPERASQILAECSFGWLDYFGKGRHWPGMIFKSGSFAAFCAHGIVPILAHPESDLAINRDALPGPFYLAGPDIQFPPPAHLVETQRAIYGWYHRHASSSRTAEVYAEMLQ
jgi:hypothetical protein